MDSLENFVKSIDSSSFLIIIIVVIVLTLLCANYKNYVNNGSKCKENLESISKIQLSDCMEYSQSVKHEPIQPVQPVQPVQKKTKLSFYHMDGCGYCQIFKPEWENLKNTAASTELQNVLELEENNCRQNPAECIANSEYIKGFPTIILTNIDGTKVIYNDYPRTHNSVLNFIKENM